MINAYIQLLKTMNERTNVYSKHAYDRLPFHINDSTIMADMIGNTNQTVLDMGSGSGLPSVIIAICNPNNHVIAVESKSRKTAFLSHVKTELNLTNYTVITGDIHQISHQLPPIDCVTAKAFKPVPSVIAIYNRLPHAPTQLIIPISANQKASIDAEDLAPVISREYQSETFYYVVCDRRGSSTKAFRQQ